MLVRKLFLLVAMFQAAYVRVWQGPIGPGLDV